MASACGVAKSEHNRTHGKAMARRKKKLRKDDLDAQKGEHALYKLGHTCTTMMRDNRGVVRDVMRAVEGSVVAPPTDQTRIQ